jgi:hypothetical protein
MLILNSIHLLGSLNHVIIITSLITYTWATQAPWVATVHDDYQRVEPGPPYPSAGLPRDTLSGIYEWLPHYPKVTREVQWGVVQLSDRRSY